jgi:hypothetical protein
MHVTINGREIDVEFELGPSTRVQALDGSWSTHLAVTPHIVGGAPRGPGPEGEPLPIIEAA